MAWCHGFKYEILKTFSKVHMVCMYMEIHGHQKAAEKLYELIDLVNDHNSNYYEIILLS